MKLNCALLHGRDCSPAATTVDVPADASVADLLMAIQAAAPLAAENNEALALYLATTSSKNDRAWLQRVKLPLVSAALVGQVCILLNDRAQRLACDELFGRDFDSSDSDIDIHVVAVVSDNSSSDTDDDVDGPPRKRARTTDSSLTFSTQPNAILGMCSIPFDTIDAFSAIQGALTLRERKPMVLHCGPLFAGKTAIALGIRQWIGAVMRDPNCCSIADLQAPQLDNHAAVWRAVGACIHRDVTCTDKASFVRVSAKRLSPWFLVLDNFHLVVAQPLLASQFLDALGQLRELPHFCGFLGIGNHTLALLPRNSGGLFHPDAIVESKPLTEEQVAGLIDQVGVFDDSLRRGLMAYSGGSLGIFCSLIKFTARNDKNLLAYDEWRHWFETTAFAGYVTINWEMFRPLCDEWCELTQRKWGNLTVALKKRKHTSDPVPLYLRPASTGDHDEAETRLEELANDISDNEINNTNNKEVRPAMDGYERMCKRIRGWYLRIIVDCRRRAAAIQANGETESILIIRKLDDKTAVKRTTTTFHVVTP